MFVIIILLLKLRVKNNSVNKMVAHEVQPPAGIRFVGYYQAIPNILEKHY